MLDVGGEVAQLLADTALGVAGGLIFVAERDGRLVGAGDVAHLGLIPPRRLVDRSELRPCGDTLGVELRLQLACLLEVAPCRPLGGVPPCLGRRPGQLCRAHQRLAHIALGFFKHSIGL